MQLKYNKVTIKIPLNKSYYIPKHDLFKSSVTKSFLKSNICSAKFLHKVQLPETNNNHHKYLYTSSMSYWPINRPPPSCPKTWYCDL